MKINFKKCCVSCPKRKTYFNEYPTYSSDSGNQLMVSTTIGCEHEEVCGIYMEADENEKIFVG